MLLSESALSANVNYDWQTPAEEISNVVQCLIAPPSFNDNSVKPCVPNVAPDS
jgi:hypothetical protein